MENTIKAEINKLEEKTSQGILVSGSTIAALCQINKDFGDKVEATIYTVAKLGKTKQGWKVFNTDLSEKTKTAVYTKDQINKWNFFAKELFGSIPQNFIKRFNSFNQPEDIEDFQTKVAFSDLDEQPICESEYK